jgi:hypothetical protein
VAAGGDLGEPLDQALKIGGEGGGESDCFDLTTEPSLAIARLQSSRRAVDPIVDLDTMDPGSSGYFFVNWRGGADTKTAVSCGFSPKPLQGDYTRIHAPVDGQ